VIPIASFVLALFSAWEKPIIAANNYKSKPADRNVPFPKQELQRTKYYESKSVYFSAYVFKQIIYLLMVMFYISEIGVAPLEILLINKPKFMTAILASFTAGFVSGKIIHFCNIILILQKITKELESQIARYKNRSKKQFN
jgi:hypothetical protein